MTLGSSFDHRHLLHALERLRLALLRLQAGVGSVPGLTLALERARAIGEHIDRRLEAARVVQGLI